MVSEFVCALALIAAGLGAAFALRAAWRARASGKRASLIAAGWAIFAVALLAATAPLGAARGLFAALSLLSLGPLLLIAFTLQRRAARTRAPKDNDAALEPSERPSRIWRGVLRALLAGPIGGLAAMGVGVAVAVFTPGDQQTRIVIGGLTVPLLWAAGMAWTLSDDRILRATGVLVGLAAITFTASALHGFA